MKRYCLGFLFRPNHEWVVMLQKTHGPGDMAGRFNGIGGHVEENEVSLAAMKREGREELGIEPDWLPFCTMHDNGGEWVCDCFVAVIANDVDLPPVNDAGESVSEHRPPQLLRRDDIMLNLRWLVPMAMEKGVTAEVYYPAGQRGDR
jgi:8-oxo-dGTP diphosphatase